MANYISELPLAIVYIGKEFSNQMIVDSTEIVSVELQDVGVL